MRSNIYVSAVAAMISAPSALAWQHIQVNACVWQPQQRAKYTLDWSIKALQTGCEQPNFMGRAIEITEPGLTCVDLGYFYIDPPCEQQDSSAYFVLSYKTRKGQTYSGSATLLYDHDGNGSRWRGSLRLRDASQGTSICMTESHCSSYNQYWTSGNETVYVVFEPGQTGYGGYTVYNDVQSLGAGVLDAPPIDAPVQEE